MKKKVRLAKKKCCLQAPPMPHPILALLTPQYDTDLLHHQIVRFQEPQLFSLA